MRIKRWDVSAAVGAPVNASAVASIGRTSTAFIAHDQRRQQAQHLASMSGHSGWVNALVATPMVLISGSSDATIRLWSSGSNRPQHVFRDPHTDYIMALVASENAQRFVSAGLQGQLAFWDLPRCVRISQAQADDSGHHARNQPLPIIESGTVTSGSIYALDCAAQCQVAAFNGTSGYASCSV